MSTFYLFIFFISGAKDVFLKAGSLGDLGVPNKCFSEGKFFKKKQQTTV